MLSVFKPSWLIKVEQAGATLLKKQCIHAASEEFLILTATLPKKLTCDKYESLCSINVFLVWII